MKDRYSVSAFPSLFGTPWHFRFKLVAYIAAHLRYLGGAVEIRVIDKLTGDHLKVL